MAEPIRFSNAEVPNSEEAEMAVLGSMMLAWTVARDVLPILEAEDFYLPRHQTIYGAMQVLRRRGSVIDMVTVRNELAENGMLDKVGGVRYLAALHDAMPAASAGRHYANIVRDKSLLRRLITAAHDMLALVGDPEIAVPDKLVRAENLVKSVHPSGMAGAHSMYDAAVQLCADDAAPVEFSPTSWRFVQYATQGKDIHGVGGLPVGYFTVVKARRGSGKTNFLAMDAAEAINAGKRVLVASLELPYREMVSLIGLYATGFDSPQSADKAGYRKVWPEFMGRLLESQSMVLDTAKFRRRPTASELIAWFDQENDNRSVFRAYLDHLSRVGLAQGQEYWQGHADNSKEFDLWTKCTGVSLVLLSQQNLDGTSKGSSVYEEDAATIIQIAKDPDTLGRVIATLDKNKYGKEGIQGVYEFADNGRLDFVQTQKPLPGKKKRGNE